MSNFLYELNEEVVDKITGICGLITARIEYIYEVNQYLLEYVVNGEKHTTWVPEGRIVKT